MKVILMRDVAKLGKRFTIAEVPDGYALNKLIPQGIAQAASLENVKKINSQKEKQTATKISETDNFIVAVKALQERPVELYVEANAQSHLFKAVKAADIAVALASAGHAIPVSAIKLVEPIKALGEYQIPVTIGAEHDLITIIIKNK